MTSSFEKLLGLSESLQREFKTSGTITDLAPGANAVLLMNGDEALKELSKNSLSQKVREVARGAGERIAKIKAAGICNFNCVNGE